MSTPIIQRSHESFRSVAARTPWTRAVIGLALTFALGSALALGVRGAGWWPGAEWERASIEAVHELTHPVLDVIMITLPFAGTNYVLAPIVLLASIWIARRGYATIAMHLVVVQLGSWALNPALKFTFPRDRPTLFEQRGQHAFPAFPSGHSIASVAVLTTIAYLLHRSGRGTWAYWVVGIYYVLNSFSRIYLGVHWPTDVIGGTAVGACWLAWTLHLFRPVHEPAEPQPALQRDRTRA